MKPLGRRTGMDLDNLESRKDSDILASFHGVEQVYDEAQCKDVFMAVMQTQGGEARMVGITQIMGLRMAFTMTSEANAGSAKRFALLQQEDFATERANAAIELAIEAAKAGTAPVILSAENFPQSVVSESAGILARYKKGSTLGG